MDNLFSKILNINDLDGFASGDSKIHSLHPLFKLISTLLFLIFILTSFDLYFELALLVLLVILAMIADISISKIFKRSLIGLPFVLCIGISYLLFNRAPMPFFMTEGVYLCILILLKTFLCISYTYILVLTTSFTLICSELVALHIPAIFIMQLAMTYRYIFTIMYEARNMYIAYVLRHPSAKGIDLKDMGSFVGHLLIKSMKDSQKIFYAMTLRGYSIEKTYTQVTKMPVDAYFLLMMLCSVLILLKVVL